MSNATTNLTDDPALLKAMIAALLADNAKMSATLQAHDQLIQTLRLRIAKLKKQVFGKSSEKIEREIEQLELALEDLLIAAAEGNTAPIDEADETASVVPLADASEKIMRRRPRVSDKAVRERRELDPGTCCPECGGELRLVGEDASEILDMIAALCVVERTDTIEGFPRDLGFVRCPDIMEVSSPVGPAGSFFEAREPIRSR